MELSFLPVQFLARGGDIDGQQRQVLYLADDLAQQNVTLTVTVSESGNLHNELLLRGVESCVSRMSPWRSVARVVDRYVDAHRLLRIARDRKVKIVHAHDVWRVEYARFIARRLAIPYVVHVRGPLSQRDIKKHRLGLADTVIAIAQRYVDDLLQSGIEAARITLIDDAVNLSLFTAAHADTSYIQRNFGIQGPLLVGVVGRISAFKKICEFLGAVRRLPSEVLGMTEFVIAGEWDSSEYRQHVEAEVSRLALMDRVHFIGRCSSDLMPKLLSSLDLLVTLSGGSVMFEAMAMRKPVLSIRSDGRHSQHTKHGLTAWCVDGNDEEAAAKALTHLLLDEELRNRLGDAARAWVERYLSSPAMVGKVKGLYEALTR